MILNGLPSRVSRSFAAVLTCNWVNRGGSLQGVEGQVEFSGALAEFIPFLHLGSMLNIGKGAAYGMGNYSFSAD